MTELPQLFLGLQIPPASERPAWLMELIERAFSQEEELKGLHEVVQSLKTQLAQHRPGPAPALDIEDDTPNVDASGKGLKKTYEPLRIDEQALEAQAEKERAGAREERAEPPPAPVKKEEEEEEPIFEDLIEEEEEAQREVDPKYSVTVDRDLMELIPLFLKQRSQEAEDISLWVKMGEDAKIVQTCMRARGVALTYGFDYLAKLLVALPQAVQKQDRKMADKLIFEINFLLDQCHIIYG